MKKLVMLIGLTLVSLAIACPVKKGYIANGLIKNTYSTDILAPVCGEMRDYVATSIFKTMKWTELYGLKNTNGGKLQIAVIQKLLVHNGYKEIGSQPTGKGTMWRYDRGSKTVMLMTAVNDPLILLAIAGK